MIFRNMGRVKKRICMASILLSALFMCMSLCLFLEGTESALATSRSSRTATYDEDNSLVDTDDRITDPDDDAAGSGFSITYNNGDGNLTGSLQILLVLTAIALAPSALIMLTSFVRIIIVLHFVRQALNTQTAPPNMVMIGIALFLTIYIMNPVFTQIYDEAIVPLDAGEITTQEAFDIGMGPLRTFMYGQTQMKDLNLFLEISGYEEAQDVEEVPIYVLIPSFILSELRTAFIIGFLIYVPFIVIDMVVASILMSMGMMMLPPTTISMPFKILLFVMADGWDLVIGGLVKTFY